MQGYISVNGVINPPDQACVPAMDRGFLFGENIFETLVGFSGVVINIPAHLQRMRRSAEMIGLELDLKDEQIQFEIQHIASMLPFAKSLIRLVITGGNGMGLVRPAASPCNRVIYGLKAPELDPLVDTQGYALKQIKLPYTERGGSAKTGNYIRSIKALSQAQKQGFHDIIWENQEGEMTESSVANIFFIGRQGDLLEIVTPPKESKE